MRIELHTCPIVAHTHTRSNTNVAIQTYGLFVQGQPDTGIQSTNGDRWEAVIAIATYLDSAWWWDYDLILHQTPMTPRNSSNINVHAVRPGATRHRSIHSSQHRHCNAFKQRVRVRLRPHTASNINKATPPNSSNVNSRAVCLEPPNTIFSPRIQ